MTVNYRVPELLLGTTEYTNKVYIWSMGCVFAEIELKRPAFLGQGDLDVFNRILKL